VLARDALLHYAHFACIFLLASVLAGELFLLRKSLPPGMLRQLQIVDRWYGILAGLVILTGLSLVFFGLKGPAFYAHNPVFWTKMVLFVAVAVLSIVPTMAYLSWNNRVAADGSVILQDAEFGRIRAFLWVQVCLFALIPLCAAFMANGL
jgi:putative membrane protein